MAWLCDGLASMSAQGTSNLWLYFLLGLMKNSGSKVMLPECLELTTQRPTLSITTNYLTLCCQGCKELTINHPTLCCQGCKELTTTHPTLCCQGCKELTTNHPTLCCQGCKEITNHPKIQDSRFKCVYSDIIIVQVQIQSRRLSLRSLLTAGMRPTLLTDNRQYTRIGYQFISMRDSVYYILLIKKREQGAGNMDMFILNNTLICVCVQKKESY